MTRKELAAAIHWGKTTMTGSYSLALLIEAAEEHLKTMPEPVAVTTYMVTAVRIGRWGTQADWRGCTSREDAEQTMATWRLDPLYADVKITEITNRA